MFVQSVSIFFGLIQYDRSGQNISSVVIFLLGTFKIMGGLGKNWPLKRPFSFTLFGVLSFGLLQRFPHMLRKNDPIEKWSSQWGDLHPRSSKVRLTFFTTDNFIWFDMVGS